MHRMLTTPFHLVMAGALMAACCLPAAAADGYDSDNADSKYEAAKSRCDTMSGTQKETCLRQADHKRDKADKKEYKAEKKKCEAMSGTDKDTCMQNLKMQHEQHEKME